MDTQIAKQKDSLITLRNVIEDKRYAFFDKGDFNLNLIAIREDDVFDNRFSDTLYCVYKTKDEWRQIMLPWTTLAGTLGFGGEQSPLTAEQTGTGVSGVAIILEGQHRGAFEWIENGWMYPFKQYFRQRKPLKYLRDNDKNGIVSRDGIIYEGNYQTHMHAMSPEGVFSGQVNYPGYYGAWSQGCQGTHWGSFQELKMITRRAVALWGNVFTYTLLHRKDFNLQ